MIVWSFSSSLILDGAILDLAWQGGSRLEGRMDVEVFGTLGAFGRGENERSDSKGSADVNEECRDVTPDPPGSTPSRTSLREMILNELRGDRFDHAALGVTPLKLNEFGLWDPRGSTGPLLPD
jgi:hypothetical protein